MRRFSLLIAIAVGAALVIGVAPASSLDEPEVIRLVDVEETFTPLDDVDFSETGLPPIGGRFSSRDGLYRWEGTKRGTRIGRLEGLCTWVDVEPRGGFVSALCTAVVFLPAGQIVLVAQLRFSEEEGRTLVIPVVGGTGRYANARGTLTLRDLSSGNQAAVFRLVP
jgi:hypothetical protein